MPNHPSYSQICGRVNKLDISAKRSDDNNNNDDDDIVIVLDSTGIKVTNRGQWMHKKWHIKKKKGYLKIHIAVNIKTNKEILALEVTDKKSHDGKVIPRLIEHVLKNNEDVKIESALGDGS